MPDLPPPNWYTDPSDESQYRYWDGSAWTDHHAPRYGERADGGLRPAGNVLRDSFSLMRRQWRGSAVAVALMALSYILVTLSFLFSVNNILMGELGEIWQRVTEPGFDATTPDNEAYFESLEFDFSLQNFVPGIVGLLVAWVVSIFANASISILAISDLSGLSMKLPGALRRALTRVPRLAGVNLQVLLLGLLSLAIIVLPSLVVPALLLLLIPLFLVFFLLSITVVSLAYVVAAVGPVEPSLRNAVRLVRGRFWRVLGRILLVMFVAMVVSFATGAVVGIATLSLGPLSWVAQVVNSLVSFIFSVVVMIASAIIYHDLGGESE